VSSDSSRSDRWREWREISMRYQSPRELWVIMLQKMRMRMREQRRSNKIEGNRLWREKLESEAR
jgi:hypothetical protein